MPCVVHPACNTIFFRSVENIDHWIISSTASNLKLPELLCTTTEYQVLFLIRMFWCVIPQPFSQMT